MRYYVVLVYKERANVPDRQLRLIRKTKGAGVVEMSQRGDALTQILSLPSGWV
jgi:hypothetical protein